MFDCKRVSTVKMYRFQGDEYLRVWFRLGGMYDFHVESSFSGLEWCKRKGITVIDGFVTAPDGRQYAIRRNAESTLVCATPA